MSHDDASETKPGRPAALRVRDVAAGFGDQPGLRAISFEVKDAERFVIVGPSGAGKTTLLRAIAGLIPVSRGHVEIAGSDRTHLVAERRDAVYLHQTPVLFPHLDVFENVAFPLRVRGVATPEIHDRVARVLDSVQLGSFATRRPHALSGGQRHRVALARAIIARPAVLLLDEPLSSLDPALRSDVREVILDIARTYRPALVIVTHDLDDAAFMGNRIGVLLDGRLEQIATPAELFTHPASLPIARLLAISNEVCGVIERERVFCSPLGEMRLTSDMPSGNGVMVFRADAVQLIPESASAVQCTGVVVELHHRPQQTTLRVRVESARGTTLIEAAIDSMQALAIGSVVGLSVDPRRVSVFSQP
ncbi:MAG: ABC transporter ATP-binding protein [Gemmatimonadaceae bacterium]